MNIELIIGVFVVCALGGVMCNFLYALRLYKDAPEKKNMGFNKYLNALMMDVSPWEKPLLVYEGERLRIFLQFRKIVLAILCVAGFCALILIVNKLLSG